MHTHSIHHHIYIYICIYIEPFSWGIFSRNRLAVVQLSCGSRCCMQGNRALMMWCMHLLIVKANTQLVGVQLGRTAPPPATASHAAPPAAGELAASSPASLPPEIYQ